MGHLSYEEQKKSVIKGLVLLAVITLIEVIFSLFGKGHIVEGVENSSAVIWGVAFMLIVLSLYKAYFIIYHFMHLKDESKILGRSLMIPAALLLVWPIIAFAQEGDAWKNRRVNKNGNSSSPTNIEVKENKQEGSLIKDEKDVFVPSIG